MPHTINSYLDALGKQLEMPLLAKRKVLRELRQHLTDAAADIGEQAAIEALGSPQVLAARFAAEGRPRGRRYTAVPAILAVGAAAAVTAVVLTRGSSVPASTAIPGVRLALLQEQRGHYHSARRSIVRALSDRPDDWRLWLLRSRIESELGDISAARQSLQHAQTLTARTSVQRLLISVHPRPRRLPPPHPGASRSAIVSTEPSRLHQTERLDFGPPTAALVRWRTIRRLRLPRAPAPRASPLTPSRLDQPMMAVLPGGRRVHFSWTWVRLSRTCIMPVAPTFPVMMEPMPRGNGCTKFGFPRKSA
jgi:hypothetical protein